MKKRYIIIGFLALTTLVLVEEFLRQVPLYALYYEVDEEFQGEALRFLVVGDIGAFDPDQKRVAEHMEELCRTYAPQAMFFLGDNFYNHGVASVDDPQWDEKFVRMYGGDCLGKIKVYAVLGNHDYQGNVTAEIQYTEFDKTRRWVMPARYYRVKFGSLLTVLAVDTNFPDKCYFPELCSLDWLARESARAETLWTIAMGHHPIISGGKYKKLRWHLDWALGDGVCDMGPDFYFSGHDHNFQHTIAEVGSWRPCEMNHFTVGTGGSPLVNVAPIPGKSQFVRKTHGVGLLQLNKDKMRFEFFETSSRERLYVYEKVASTSE